MHNFFKALKNIPIQRSREPLEYRLYYDTKSGDALYYSMEKNEGSFIVIDEETFVRSKMDIQVIDKKLHTKIHSIVYKLVPTNDGTPCYKDDISIIDDSSDVFWGDKTKSTEVI